MEKGSSSSSSSSPSSDSLIGLKFGKKIYFEGSASGGGAPSLPPTSPAKRGRTSGVIPVVHPPRCQVEGCHVDLSDAKAYYSRHKVCGMHSKSSTVTVGGMEQRFCQQCSRFHQLSEFDQGKRSCRRRLAGHNERRRKPPTGSIMSPRYGTLSPSIFDHHPKTGGFVMDFGSYPGREPWPNTTPERGFGNQAPKYQQPPWMTNNSQTDLPEGSTNTRPTAAYSAGPPNILSSEECYNDSSSALSLLSNQQQQWDSRNNTSNSNNFLGANESIIVDSTQVNHDQFSWGFKGNHGDTSLHEMPPDLGLGQVNSDARQIELAQPTQGQFQQMEHSISRGYDSSVQDHMHWSL